MTNRPIPSPHRPPHIYAGNTTYFVTGSIHKGARLLAPPTHKPHLQQELLTLAPDYGLELFAWVILDNHYHLLFHLAESENLHRFFKRFHGRSAFTFNKWDHQPGRQVWYNYWDRCIRDERDYWTHFNYIHYNPIKHGYARQLRDWPFSSIFIYLEREGRNWLDDCWRKYPIKEFEIENDDF